MKAYIISLPRCTERRELAHAEAKSLGLPIVDIEAVDGRKLTYPHPDFDEHSYILRQGRRLIPGEVGCYFSHLHALLSFLASGDSHGLILEDDVQFDTDAATCLKEALAASDDWDMLRLSSVNKGKIHPTRPLPGGRDLGVPLTRQKGAAAYIVNRHAASRLQTHLRKMILPWDQAFDLEWLHDFRTLHLTPYPAHQRDLGTTIQINLRSYYLPPWKRYWTVLPYRISLETGRAFTRGLTLLKKSVRKTSARQGPISERSGG